MKEIKEVFLTGVDRYFTHLSNFGTINNTNKNAVIITLFIGQILNGPLASFVSEKDYRIMDNLLHCLYLKSCLITYNKFCESKSLLKDMDTEKNPKLTQERLFRTSDDKIRFHII